MPAPIAVRILAKKIQPEPGLCILTENGSPCPRSVDQRGLCGTHVTYLRKENRLEEFALPKVSKRYDLRPNPDAPAGVCGVLEAGIPCRAPAQRRGICKRHYAGIWQRPDLKIEDFARDSVKPTLERKKNLNPGQCVLRERLPDGRTIMCHATPLARGLCAPHYKRLEKQPELFQVLANQIKKPTEFRRKKDIRAGICQVIQDDIGCTRPTKQKPFICLNHHRLLRKVGQLPELTEVENKILTLTKKKPEEIVEGECLASVNGHPCRNVPKRRGLCGNCLYQITKQKLNLEDFARPAIEKVKHGEFKRRSPVVVGLCILIEGGVACHSPSVTRGLCRPHYKLLEHYQALPRIALSEEELKRIPRVPHWYFDKNIIIDFARQELFRDPAVPESPLLVEAVLRNHVQASVSLDCLRALYSYIGHRLARPVEEGGRGLEPREAERQAREYAGKLFFARGGLWHLVAYDIHQVGGVLAQGKLPALSLEDALEVQLFAKVRLEHAATLFVTADRELLDAGHGVHPRRIIQEFAEIFGRPSLTAGR